MEDNKSWVYYKRKIEPYIAVGILVSLIMLAGLLWQDNKLKAVIGEECGWEDEHFRCYCEKVDVLGIEELILGTLNTTRFNNVTLVE